MKSLVIVESPTKARTISRFLGNDYIIKASMGHIMDLPKSTLGVDIEHEFKPQYELMKDKQRTISELKNAVKDAESIILATDPDREGEAIAYHVKDVLDSSSKFKVQNSKFVRIVFHEITKEAIEEALKNPRTIDLNLVDAQTARRVLDRLVGYKLSPLLWQKVRKGLSAGRVQSIALRLIVEREREIEKFEKEKYWTISAFFSQQPRVANDARTTGSNLQAQTRSLSESGQPSNFENQNNTKSAFSSFASGLPPSKDEGTEFELIEINGEKIELQNSFQLYDGEYKITKTTIDNLEKAENILADLKGKQFQVLDILQKETKRSPQVPYTTSTLQQDASRRFGFPGKRTMRTAQKLYEEGYITYHRTDSVVLSSSAIFKIRDFIKKSYGEKYVPEKPRIYTTKQKLAQEAHEAIRPTSVVEVSNLKTQILNDVGNDGWRLYELIWKRAVASQMADAVIESTTVVVETSRKSQSVRGPVSSIPPASARSSLSANAEPNELRAGGSPSSAATPNQTSSIFNKYRLKASGSVLVFDGFLKINPQALEDKRLPEFKTGEILSLTNVKSEEHETTPPPRYNDASIIKTLEEKGIGRPSTYATIISTIEDRGYVEREDKKFMPTPVGMAVNDFLVKNFSTIDDIPFTAEMEENLDQIANGEKKWVPVIKDFYSPFEKKLEEVKKVDRVQIAVEQTSEKCPKCGAFLVVRHGRFGKFLSCSTFPKCDFTKNFVEETNLACPKDGGKIIIKKTKRGRKFYGCSNYPKCDFAAWKLEDIKKN